MPLVATKDLALTTKTANPIDPDRVLINGLEWALTVAAPFKQFEPWQSSTTRDEAVEVETVTDKSAVSAFTPTQYQPGDKVLITSGPNAGRQARMKALAIDASDPNSWVVDSVQPRTYSSEAARLARSEFALNPGELFSVNGATVTWRSDATDPANAALDQPIGSGLKLTPLPDPSVALKTGNLYFGDVENVTYAIAAPQAGEPLGLSFVNINHAKSNKFFYYTSPIPVLRPDDGADLTSLPAVSVSPSVKHNLVWKQASNVFHLESPRSSHVPIEFVDSGISLIIDTDYTVTNGANASTDLVVKVPAIAAGSLEIYYDPLSTGPLRIEQLFLPGEDETTGTHIIQRDGGINWFTQIKLEHKGSWIRMHPTRNGFWAIDILKPYDPGTQVRILEFITIQNIYSNGSNSGSRFSYVFVDEDGNDYPASAWALTGTIVGRNQPNIVLNGYTHSTVNLGWNKGLSNIKAYYIGSTPNGISDVRFSTGPNTTISETVRLKYEGTNGTESFKSGDDPITWSSLKAVSGTDQGAPWLPRQEYLVDNIISFPEQDPDDEFAGQLFNWKVKTQIDTDEFTTWDATNFAAVQAKLERSAVGTIAPEISLGRLRAVDRVVSAPDPIPNTGEPPFSRILYQGNTTSQIYEYDNAGATPTPVTDPGSADWYTGLLVRDIETNTDYQYDRSTNRFSEGVSIVGNYSSKLTDIHTLDAANSSIQPTDQEKTIDSWGIRTVKSGFTDSAQKQTWKVTETGDIEVALIKHSVKPITIEVYETGTSNNYSVNINLDGTTAQPIGDATNELDQLKTSVKDFTDYWLVEIEGTRPDNIDLLFWGNPIGIPGTSEDIEYAFRLAETQPIDATPQKIAEFTASGNTGTYVPIGDFGLEVQLFQPEQQTYLRRTDNNWKLIDCTSWYRLGNGAGNTSDREIQNLTVNQVQTLWPSTGLNMGNVGDTEYLDFTALNGQTGKQRRFRLKATVGALYNNNSYILTEYGYSVDTTIDLSQVRRVVWDGNASNGTNIPLGNSIGNLYDEGWRLLKIYGLYSVGGIGLIRPHNQSTEIYLEHIANLNDGENLDFIELYHQRDNLGKHKLLKGNGGGDIHKDTTAFRLEANNMDTSGNRIALRIELWKSVQIDVVEEPTPEIRATPNILQIGERLVQNGINPGANSGTVTFPEPFKVGTIPTVIPVPQAVGDNANVTLQNVTNTGFTSWIVRNESDVGVNYDLHWEAIGTAPN